MEEWREVLGFDTLYEVSNEGRVRTRRSKEKGYTAEYHIVEPLDNGNGYLRFNWKLKGNQRTIYLHKLVAEYFVNNPRHLCEVNHKDENKHNNCADNLEWCSHKYNCNYGTRNSRAGKKNKRVLCIETDIVYDSISIASEALGVGKSALSNCLNGRSKSCCGYSWRYVNEIQSI